MTAVYVVSIFPPMEHPKRTLGPHVLLATGWLRDSWHAREPSEEHKLRSPGKKVFFSVDHLVSNQLLARVLSILTIYLVGGFEMVYLVGMAFTWPAFFGMGHHQPACITLKRMISTGPSPLGTRECLNKHRPALKSWAVGSVQFSNGIPTLFCPDQAFQFPIIQGRVGSGNGGATVMIDWPLQSTPELALNKTLDRYGTTTMIGPSEPSRVLIMTDRHQRQLIMIIQHHHHYHHHDQPSLTFAHD